MVFAILFILHCVLHLNNAHYSFHQYFTQNKINLQIETTNKVSVCECKAQKCELNDKIGEEVCTAVLKRFQKAGILNPGFVHCQLDRQTCKGKENANPNVLPLKLIGDRYFMETSPIWMGTRSVLLIVRQIFNHTNFDEDAISSMRLQSAVLNTGDYGMPIEFTGVLRNRDQQQINSYHHCVSQECIRDVNLLCTQFYLSLRVANVPIMNYYRGCHVRRFYMEGGLPRVNWAMLFDYEHLVRSGVMNTFTEMQNILTHIRSKTVPTDPIHSFTVLKAYPLDFCSIRVRGEAAHQYHEDLSNPLALRTRYLVNRHYKSFIEQLMNGDGKCPTCIRKLVGLEFTNSDKKVTIDMDLWVSGSCFKQRGFKSCKEITKEVERQCTDGQTYFWNDYASNYKFALKHSASFMDK